MRPPRLSPCLAAACRAAVRGEHGPPRSGSLGEPCVPHIRPSRHRVPSDRRKLHAQAQDHGLPSRPWSCSAQPCAADDTNKAVSASGLRACTCQQTISACTFDARLIHIVASTIGSDKLSDASLSWRLAAVTCTEPTTDGGARPRHRAAPPRGGWPGAHASRLPARRGSPHGKGGLWITCGGEICDVDYD